MGCRAENSVRKRDAAGVGAGVPAKNSTRWLAPAAPVFAGTPAPTRALLNQKVIYCPAKARPSP
ncbi:hypothetical protein EGJ22_05205 [Pseudomonas sp. p99-361]|nr:hypothetical protein HV87_10660 [Pseudomonas aeruginosa]QEQ90493.1 hypothetical protein F1602_04145 [Pseudomonas putida]RRV22003.1 hypothetical protein EGJ22_05205 [Pseudomonas sp. p99-361]